MAVLRASTGVCCPHSDPLQVVQARAGGGSEAGTARRQVQARPKARSLPAPHPLKGRPAKVEEQHLCQMKLWRSGLMSSWFELHISTLQSSAAFVLTSLWQPAM